MIDGRRPFATNLVVACERRPVVLRAVVGAVVKTSRFPDGGAIKTQGLPAKAAIKTIAHNEPTNQLSSPTRAIATDRITV